MLCLRDEGGVSLVKVVLNVRNENNCELNSNDDWKDFDRKLECKIMTVSLNVKCFADKPRNRRINLKAFSRRSHPPFEHSHQSREPIERPPIPY